jgi:hypothetical protein
MASSQTIKLKRSAVAGTVPTTAKIALGELAMNTADGKIYFERGDDSIQTILTTNALVTGSLDLSGACAVTGSLNVNTGRIYEEGTSVIDHATAMAIVFGG